MSKVIPLCYTKACDGCILRTHCPALQRFKTNDHCGLRTRVYKKGELAFSEGDAFKGLFILRVGSALSSIVSEDGQRQVTHFHYAKDIFGFDGFDSGYHISRIKFLETSNVCQLEPSFLEKQLASSKEVRQKLLQAMSHSFISGNVKRLEQNYKNAEQRLCQFIIDLSAHQQKLNRHYNPLFLSMTRRDLGNYLGMAIETVSRVLTTLINDKIISVKHRFIEIHDFEKLRALCHSNAAHSQIVNQSMHQRSQANVQNQVI